jgi:hypothetical protein
MHVLLELVLGNRISIVSIPLCFVQVHIQFFYNLLVDHTMGMFGTAPLNILHLCSTNSTIEQLHCGVSEFFYEFFIQPSSSSRIVRFWWELY